MADSKIIGYKKIFGFVLPDWVNESMVRIFGICILLAAGMLLVLIFVVRPAYETLEARLADLNSNKTSLETLRESRDGLTRMRTDISVSDQEKILQAMPRQYSPEGAIFALRRISADTGVNIVSYSLPAGVLVDSTEPVSGAPTGDVVQFAAFPIRITVAAPVESVLRFIERVESSLPFGVVSDLNLQEVTRLTRTQTDKTVQLALEIRYFQSMIGRLNISRMQPFTEEDLVMARELSAYNVLMVPESDVETGQASLSATGSGSIFGF